METDFRANNGFHKQKKAVNKRILFPLDKDFDSISQNEGFVKNIRFQHEEKLKGYFHPSAEIFNNNCKKWFPTVKERLLYKK